jgi:hypothetical protein
VNLSVHISPSKKCLLWKLHVSPFKYVYYRNENLMYTLNSYRLESKQRNTAAGNTDFQFSQATSTAFLCCHSSQNIYRLFQKELYNGIPNVTVWAVFRKLLQLETYQLSIVQHLQRRIVSTYCKRFRYTRHTFPFGIQLIVKHF